VRTGPPVDITTRQLVSLWKSITCPVLLCWGDKSWAQDPTEQAREFQDAQVARCEDAGHWLHHDKFDEFIRVVRGFL
jgi:pimeloyl-ACP methyl ester carboxylesterase